MNQPSSVQRSGGGGGGPSHHHPILSSGCRVAAPGSPRAVRGGRARGCGTGRRRAGGAGGGAAARGGRSTHLGARRCWDKTPLFIHHVSHAPSCAASRCSSTSASRELAYDH